MNILKNNNKIYFNTGQEVSSYWYAAVRQYGYFKEPDILHANVNAGMLNKAEYFLLMKNRLIM